MAFIKSSDCNFNVLVINLIFAVRQKNIGNCQIIVQDSWTAHEFQATEKLHNDWDFLINEKITEEILYFNFGQKTSSIEKSHDILDVSWRDRFSVNEVD